jgi:hypothetical protein
MKHRAITLIVGIAALACFAVLFGCAIVSTAWMRLRHGKSYEAGGGVGFDEDYA